MDKFKSILQFSYPSKNSLFPNFQISMQIKIPAFQSSNMHLKFTQYNVHVVIWGMLSTFGGVSRLGTILSTLERGKTLSNFQWTQRSIKINASGTVLSAKLEPLNIEIKIIKKKLVYIHQVLLLNRGKMDL